MTNNSLEQTKKPEWVEAGSLDEYLNFIGYEIVGCGVECPRCHIYGAEFLFNEKRYKKPTLIMESKYLFTWSYYECKNCRLVFTERLTDDSLDGTKKCTRCGQETDTLHPLLNCEAKVVEELCEACHRRDSELYSIE